MDNHIMTDNALSLMAQSDTLLAQHAEAEKARLKKEEELTEALNKAAMAPRETLYKGGAFPAKEAVDG